MTSKALKWRGHVHGWRASGKSAAAYSAEHGLKVWSLRYWANQIPERGPLDAQQGASLGAVRLAQVRTKSIVNPANRSEPAPGALQLTVGGLTLQVPPDVDRAVLRDVVSVVLDVVEARR